MDLPPRIAISKHGSDGFLPEGFSNGASGAFDAPPSTMAVQLIDKLHDKLPTVHKPSNLLPEEQDDLTRLTKEVADFEKDVSKTHTDAEKLEHQHKLIYVFARAVLEGLSSDNPFVNIPQLVSHASDTLGVFAEVIKENPGVLDYVLPPGITLEARGREPLWVWLFPRVLTLLSRRDCESLVEKIKDFFYVSFQAVARSPKFWNLSSFFFSYLKECVSNALIQLDNPSVISHGTLLQITLPSDDTEYPFYFSESNEGSPNPLLHCNYTIRGAAEVFSHVSNILSMLVDISMVSATSYDPTPAFQDYLAWLLDSFCTTHELCKRWQANPLLYEACVQSGFMSFCAVHTLSKSLRASLSPPLVRKAYSVLSDLCADALENPTRLSEDPTGFVLCSTILNLAAVCKVHSQLRRTVSVKLLPAIQAASVDGYLNKNFQKDFKNGGVALCKACNIQISGVDENAPTDFDNEKLSAEFRGLGLLNDASKDLNMENGPPAKRRKVHEENSLPNKIIGHLYTLLGAQEATDLAGLSQMVEPCFSTLSEVDRCKAVESLGRLPCSVSGQVTVTREDGKIKDWKCLICEGGPASDLAVLDKNQRQEIMYDAIATFSSLIKSPAFLESRRPRVLAMFALRSFAIHFDESTFIDLEISPLGQWCISSLRSTIRELRIAAGRTLPAFLRGSDINSLSKKNRFNVLALLRSFSDKEKPHVQETCILALGQVGRITKHEELNLVLLGLVGYLSHSNPIVSGVAFNEIIQLSRALGLTVDRLFNPFWGTIAIEAVKDLLTRPQTVQLMADLLGISVSEFLILTQSHTIPWLVLTKKVDVIRRISEARKDAEEWLVCTEWSNLVPVLTLLLTQNVRDMETFIMSLLKHVSSRFKEFDLGDLLKVEPASQALLLLKAAGEADDSKKSRIRLALQFIATRTNTNSDKVNSVGMFLEQHILGLVARLTEVINDARDEQSMTEKQRCVKATEELVKIAKTHSRVARPQICACLQSAMTQKELQASAFLAWETMLTNLEDEDVEMMLESTFSMIIQHWESFDEPTQNRAEATLQYLLKERQRSIQNMIVNLPSLSRFPKLVDVEKHLNELRTKTDIGNTFQIFSRRLGRENSAVVAQALVELKTYLELHQGFLQASAVSEQPDIAVSQLVRAILDTCVKFKESHNDIALLSVECIGLIGCIDSNRVESIREQREIVVVSNFEDPGETTDFVLFLLTEIIVPAFLSANDVILQGFFSYVMQELLDKCDFKRVYVSIQTGSGTPDLIDVWEKWLAIPTSTQDILTPFLTSKYALREMDKVKYEYPIFRPATSSNTASGKLYSHWLRSFVLDLLQKTHNNVNTKLIFPPLCRAIRIKDLSVATFLLPYVVLHTIVAGTDQQRQEIGSELLGVLQYQPPSDSSIRREDLRWCIEAVFRILDYLGRWILEKEKQMKESQSRGAIVTDKSIQRVNTVIEMIPPEIISRRAVECKSYSRALYYWEQHIRDVRKTDKSQETNTSLLEHLQDIYTQIDEPDGIEGISAHLHVLDIEQQILGHRKAGRWTAAQSWYEIKLAENPDDTDIQMNLLTCLRESGQHDVLLNYVEGINTGSQNVSKLLPFAAEASWETGRWMMLDKYTSLASPGSGEDFNISVGRSLLALHKKDINLFKLSIKSLREQIAQSMSTVVTSSLGACHDNMLKLHVLTELEMIAGTENNDQIDCGKILESLSRRLEIIGAYLSDKQYLLGIRRAAMELSSLEFTKGDIASAWLTSARLARKGNAVHQSFNAVLRASQLGDESATIEHARLIWKEGHHRKAIQSLQGAIDTNAFISHNKSIQATSFTGADQGGQQNLLTARAHLLLAKWLDTAGQTHSSALRMQYQLAARTHSTWEKGHYYLGRHYNKLLESEKALPPDLQNEAYLSGETAKLVIENYLRSLLYGTKYIYQTLPRILTLWLDLGMQVSQPVDAKNGNSREFAKRISDFRKSHLDLLHTRFHKYINKMPAYMFYTALPQIVARIAHPNPEVYKVLQSMIIRVVSAHPQQALWSVLAVSTSNQSDRRTRGATILQYLRDQKKQDPASVEIKGMIKNGQRITEQLLLACNAGDFHGNRTIWASLSRDINFNSKVCLPSLLAVPVESVMTATLPTLTDNIRGHKAFSRDVVTIQSFLDEVLVLSSLQKPRKLTARGSDGRKYGLMCKPKDDLRKDQRLMEFNSMINRSLKRDAESSRRQLYIKTYAVTPLNEECGIIEWVDGLKTLRDILLALYKTVGITPNYKEIEIYCERAIKSEAELPYFTEKVLGNFPPIFHKWFVQQFPEPSSWFAARLRYTRSCAVMSMVGTILGLGDRHGENILFEEGNGGTFHVDFNCLFDKGLTFVKPERVPFRLTHNMIDAMGMYGYEGPFRKSSELTLELLRQHEETLMTILEAFIYDPTLDLLAKKSEKKKREGAHHVPQTAQGVFDSIQRKVKGLLAGESVPLGVEGQVDELIKQATNQKFLASMYIGWCSFL